MADQSRAFALVLSLSGILLTSGIAAVFVLATSDRPPTAGWVAAWLLVGLGALLMLVLGTWPWATGVAHALRLRMQYRASNYLDEAGVRWLRLDRPSDDPATFVLTIVDPGKGGGRKEFGQAGNPILVDFPGRSFDVGAAPPPGKYKVRWDVYGHVEGRKQRRLRPGQRVLFFGEKTYAARHLATARDSFTLKR